MHVINMKKVLILTALVVGMGFAAPPAVMADEHQDRRYYDRNGRDYHTWNDKEDRAYRVYLGERHRDYRVFEKEKASRQRVLQVAPHSSRWRVIQSGNQVEVQGS